MPECDQNYIQGRHMGRDIFSPEFFGKWESVPCISIKWHSQEDAKNVNLEEVIDDFGRLK